MARRGRFPRDIQLSARMLLTMFLLGLVYVAFVVALVALRVPIVLVVGIAAVLFGLQYYLSDRIALFGMGGRVVSPDEAPQLHGLVERLCTLADIKKPRVAISDSDIPNAFATGRNQNAAVVCVTTGIMRRLDEPELEAVLSHELSHVAHRDVAVMTIASFLGILAGLITRFTLFAGFYGVGGDGDGDGDDGGLPVIAIVAVSVVVYAISFLLVRALSRYRELAADRSGALLTGTPSKLASALTKVTGEMGRIPTRDLRAAEAFNAFFFTPALAKGFSISSLFSTHPSLERRLDQLTRIEAELGTRA
jgi:heat shock protein HtpX